MPSSVSPSFQAFLMEAPEHGAAWMAAAKALDTASMLDAKTRALAYLAAQP